MYVQRRFFFSRSDRRRFFARFGRWAPRPKNLGRGWTEKLDRAGWSGKPVFAGTKLSESSSANDRRLDGLPEGQMDDARARALLDAERPGYKRC